MGGRRVLLLLCCVIALAGSFQARADEQQSDILPKDVTVSLLEASGAAAAQEQVSGPANLRLVLDHTRSLKISLSAALSSAPDQEFRPQQVFLRLTARATGGAAYFAAVKAKDGSLYATAKSAEVQKQVGTQSGAYELALVVGDARTAQPLLWVLGEVEVLLPPLDDGSQPAAAPYRAIDSLFQPLPEILHMHRAPERRAPAVVSLLFTLVAVAPLGAFVVLAVRAGANLKGFPTDGAGFLAAAGFHTGLAAILGLYVLFWLRLNLMQTLPILAVLAVVTAAFGRSNLIQLAAARQKQE
ncbi:hypothetical protein ABPG77_005076 [Micractinium sp. CCAP 211/92]